MASPYLLTNNDLSFVNSPGQDFNFYVAFLNPVSITTNWSDLNLDVQGNWQAPPNFDTCANQSSPYTPIANLGSNRIGFVNEPLYFDASRSSQRYDLPATIVAPSSWQLSGSPSITYWNDSNGYTQIAAVWPSPGLYSVSVTVTAVNGSQYIGYRQVMIYQDRQSALPGIISLSGLSGSISAGGWQCQVTTASGQVTLIPPDSIPVGQYYPFVVMCETRYELSPGYWRNETLGPNGAFNPGYPYTDPRILFDGYIQNETMHQDVDKDTLSFSCMGPQLILQEAKTHELGYYNATYKSYSGNGQPGNYPTSLNTSSAGQGYLIGNLMSSDVIQSILQSHSNIAQFHDIHLRVPNIATSVYEPGAPPGTAAWYNIIYTNLSVNEGTIWQNMSDICANEWTDIYTGRDGGIYMTPQVNFQGIDYWNVPTMLGKTVASSLINYAQDLGFEVGSDLTQMSNNMPAIPAQPMTVEFVHPWGTRNLVPYSIPFQNVLDSAIITTQSSLNGPPILCTFADVPSPDPGDKPLHLIPGVSNNWPQDLSVYPIDFDFAGNYTGRAALIKLIGTPYGHATLLTSWYPQDAFQVAGDGTSTIVITTLPAGDWIVNESHVVGDVTTAQNKTLIINFFWEMARREYFAHNMYYNGTITLGMFTGCSLNDIVGITRQNNITGPHWTNKYFYVTEISYDIDFTARTWATTITVNEVTSSQIGQPLPPPSVIPKF